MDTTQYFATFAVSVAIGLFVGLERERHPLTKAGLRTFALIALAGTLAALVAEETGSPWVIAASIIAVTGALAGAYFVDPRTTENDSGTTTVVAALLVFFLGILTYFGDWLLAVTLAVTITTLLHFKPELEGISKQLSAQDIRSMLQFALLTAVVLPLLPNEAFGPYGVLNPFQMWLLVLLISGVSLAGYLAFRLTAAYGNRVQRIGTLLTGVLGGIVSSTATTIATSRHVRTGTISPASATVVIVLANATMFVRVLFLTAVIAPRSLLLVAVALAPAVLLSLPGLIRAWRSGVSQAQRSNDVPSREMYRNPTNLLVALAFAAGYSVVLVVSAFLSQNIGAGALYALAVVAGSTDVDAVTLSSLQLANAHGIDETAAATAIALAVATNLTMKACFVYFIGGGEIGRAVAFAFAGPLFGLAAGTIAVYAWLG